MKHTAFVVPILLLLGCNKGSTAPENPADRTLSQSYWGKYEMVADESETKRFKDAGIPLPTLEIKSDNTWEWDHVGEIRKGKFTYREGTLELVFQTVDGAQAKEVKEPSTFERLDRDSLLVTLNSTYDEAKFKFRRMGAEEKLKAQEEAHKNAPVDEHDTSNEIPMD